MLRTQPQEWGTPKTPARCPRMSRKLSVPGRRPFRAHGRASQFQRRDRGMDRAELVKLFGKPSMSVSGGEAHALTETYWYQTSHRKRHRGPARWKGILDLPHREINAQIGGGYVSSSGHKTNLAPASSLVAGSRSGRALFADLAYGSLDSLLTGKANPILHKSKAAPVAESILFFDNNREARRRSALGVNPWRTDFSAPEPAR